MVQILTVLIFIYIKDILGKNTLFLVLLCVSHHMVQHCQPFQSFSEHFKHRELNLMVIEAEIQMPNKIGEIFLKSPHPSGGGGAGSFETKASTAKLMLELGLSLAILKTD